MKRIKDMLAFCGRLDRGFYPVMLLGALLETLEDADRANPALEVLYEK